MSRLLFIGGLLLIMVWAIGFFWFHISGIIHILPAIAILALAARLFYNKSFMPKY
jgi:hypothetical protein